MKALPVLLSVAVAGALVVALLVLRTPADDDPGADRLASASTVAPSVPASADPASPATRKKSVLLDVEGAVIEEFSGNCANSGHPYLCRYVTKRLSAEDPGLPARGGLTIRTTIDRRLQRAAQRAVDARVHRDDPQVAAQVMIVPGEGAIRAMVTSGGNGDVPGFQQGTTAMPYTLAAAFAAGLRSEDGLLVTDEYRAPNHSSFKNCANRSVADPSHSIVNREKDGKRFVTLRSGTREAVHTFFLRLQERVGLCQTVQVAERLGLRRADGRPLQEFEPFTLGINEADAVSVANSYATLAARGRFCEPTVITEIRDASGAPRSFPPRCREVLDPAVADAVTEVLSDALAGSPLKGVGREAAGMPGTNVGHTAAWYAGYTPALASAVSLGDSRGAFRHTLEDVTVGGRRYPGGDASSIPGAIWKETMTEAVRGTPETGFTRPDAGRFGACRDACPS